MSSATEEPAARSSLELRIGTAVSLRANVDDEPQSPPLGPAKSLRLAGRCLAAAALLSGVAGAAFFSTRNHPVAARHVPAPARPAPPRPSAPIRSAVAGDPAFRLQDVGPTEAAAYNAGIPFSKEPNPPAPPFRLIGATAQDEQRATDCLAAAIYYEAGGEPLAGQRAVAQVVLNRLRDPHFPKTVCGVVFQGLELTTGWQFTFVGDGSLGRKPSAAGWTNARKVAVAALHGFVAKEVGHATHYHTLWVAPYWSPSLLKVATVGGHIFYRWAGGMGLPGAFSGRYSGAEPLLPQIVALDPSLLDKTVRTPESIRLAPAAELAGAGRPEEIHAASVMELPSSSPPLPTSPTSGAAVSPAALAAVDEMKIEPGLKRPPQSGWSRLPTGSGW